MAIERDTARVAEVGTIVFALSLLGAAFSDHFIDYMVTSLTIISWLATGYFVATWGWSYTRARQHIPDYIQTSRAGVLDFVGLPAMVFIYSTLVLVQIATDGVTPADDWFAIVRRTILNLFITAFAVLRTLRWISYQQRARRSMRRGGTRPA